MRDYGKVHSSFWTSETTRSMSEDGRALALYLLTSPHNTIAGVFRLPDGYVCEDMQWTAERVSKGFAELLEKGFANRCETTKWVWVCKHLEWNPPENPNQRKSASKIAASIPSECSWKQQFGTECGEHIDNRFGTVPEPLLNQKQEQEQEQEQKQKQEKQKPPASRSAVMPPGFDLKIWQDFTAIRKAKRSPLTETALAGIEREAVKAGLTLESALRMCCERGWQGFEASWLKQSRGSAGGKSSDIEARNRESVKEAMRLAGGAGNA